MIRWVNKLFHKILLDMDMTDEEEEFFQDYKSSATVISTLPRWVVSGFRWVFGLHTARNHRDELLTKYGAAMDADTRGIIPPLEGRDKRFVADLLLTAMTSAGGLSVPTVMGVSIGILHGAQVYDHGVVMPDYQEFRLTNRNIEQFTLEAVRRFPVVVGFPWWDPNELEFRTLLNLAMSMRDPRAWEAPLEFRLRPLSEYHEVRGMGTKIGTAWAQQAVGYNGVTPDSRGCPGQDLSVAVITEFLRAYMASQDEWSVSVMPAGGIQITENPVTANSYTLTRNGASPMPESISSVDMVTPAPETQDEEDAVRMAVAQR